VNTIRPCSLDSPYREHPAIAAIHHWRANTQRKVVFTNGCFDVLHPGHLALLSFCKEISVDPLLVVGLNVDATVRKLKGPGRPVINGNDRKLQLEALRVVDHVIFFNEDTPEVLIKTINPDFLVKGADWAGRLIVGSHYVLGCGGAVVFAPRYRDFATTTILERPFADAAAEIEEGLRTDGAHHKQYYLERALKILYPKRKRGDWLPGKAP
jgi:rfaE bifunctional protein nucleotidyltransferase chain/domain